MHHVLCIGIPKKNYYEKIINNSIEKQYNILSSEKEKLVLEISKKENSLALLYDDRAAGIISIEEFQLIKGKNSLEIERIKERVKRIDIELNDMDIKRKNQIDTEKILMKYKKLKKIERRHIDEFISKIYVGYYNKEDKSRKIKIEWNFEPL